MMSTGLGPLTTSLGLGRRMGPMRSSPTSMPSLGTRLRPMRMPMPRMAGGGVPPMETWNEIRDILSVGHRSGRDFGLAHFAGGGLGALLGEVVHPAADAISRNRRLQNSGRTVEELSRGPSGMRNSETVNHGRVWRKLPDGRETLRGTEEDDGYRRALDDIHQQTFELQQRRGYAEGGSPLSTADIRTSMFNRDIGRNAGSGLQYDDDFNAMQTGDDNMGHGYDVRRPTPAPYSQPVSGMARRSMPRFNDDTDPYNSDPEGLASARMYAHERMRQAKRDRMAMELGGGDRFAPRSRWMDELPEMAMSFASNPALGGPFAALNKMSLGKGAAAGAASAFLPRKISDALEKLKFFGDAGAPTTHGDRRDPPWDSRSPYDLSR